MIIYAKKKFPKLSQSMKVRHREDICETNTEVKVYTISHFLKKIKSGVWKTSLSDEFLRSLEK